MDSVDAAGLPIGDAHPPRVMGVLNVSEKSPYDPSVFDDPGKAAQYVDETLIDEGADIVDVGLESANKRFEVLSAEEELERLHVATETIASVSGDAVFSIETRYASVAEAALNGGFDMVNDICGFADPEMPTICREYDAAVAKMASPPDLERPGAVEKTDWASARSPEWADDADYVDTIFEALKRGGMTEKTIVDPAFGGWSEAKTTDHDRETFRRLREFRALGKPMLVSINRKNFLGEIAGRETDERLPVSLAATSLAVERGAHVIRTHDVAETKDAARIGAAFDERSKAAADRERSEVTVSRLDANCVSELEAHLFERDVAPELARSWTSLVFDVDGIGGRDGRALEEVAGGTEVTVRQAGDQRLLVAGSVEELEALTAVVESESGSLAEVGARIADRL